MKLRRLEVIIGLCAFIGGIALISYDVMHNRSEDKSEKIILVRPTPSVLKEAFPPPASGKNFVFVNPFVKSPPPLKEIVVRKNEPLVPFLRKQGLSLSEAKSAQKELKPYYSDTLFRRGQRLYVSVERRGVQIVGLHRMIILLPPGKKVSLVQKDGVVIIEKRADILPKKLLHITGTIQDGFYVDGLKAGLSKASINVLNQQFSYCVDMQRSLRSGDTFEVLVERSYDKETGFIDPGSVLYACLNTKSGPQRIFRYALQNNAIEYFNEQGRGIRRALLMTPVRGARVSSRFGLRHHPIQGYTKMHRGIDFAASTGTPVLAAGSGHIRKKGYLGSYGNYILIQHNKDYASAYAHLSRFGKNLGKGSKVTQGQVIGYIGTTGRSTGPHLHYEIHYKGKQVNPHKIQLPSQRHLSGTQHQDFLTHVKSVRAQLRSLKSPLYRFFV